MGDVDVTAGGAPRGGGALEAPAVGSQARRHRRQLHEPQPVEPGSAVQTRGRSRCPPAWDRSPSPAGTQTYPPLTADIRRLVDGRLGTKQCPEITRHVKKQASESGAKIQSLQNTNRSIQSCKDVLSEMDQTPPGELPPGRGLRRIPIHFETPLLGTIRINEAISTAINIDHNTSIRDAKAIVHKEMIKLQKNLDLQLLEAQRTNLRMVTKRSNFVERCMSLDDEQKTVWSKLDLDNDDDQATLAGMSRDELELQVTTIYTSKLSTKQRQRRAQKERLNKTSSRARSF